MIFPIVVIWTVQISKIRSRLKLMSDCSFGYFFVSDETSFFSDEDDLKYIVKRYYYSTRIMMALYHFPCYKLNFRSMSQFKHVCKAFLTPISVPTCTIFYPTKASSLSWGLQHCEHHHVKCIYTQTQNFNKVFAMKNSDFGIAQNQLKQMVNRTSCDTTSLENHYLLAHPP